MIDDEKINRLKLGIKKAGPSDSLMGIGANTTLALQLAILAMLDAGSKTRSEIIGNLSKGVTLQDASGTLVVTPLDSVTDAGKLKLQDAFAMAPNMIVEKPQRNGQTLLALGVAGTEFLEQERAQNTAWGNKFGRLHVKETVAAQATAAPAKDLTKTSAYNLVVYGNIDKHHDLTWEEWHTLRNRGEKINGVRLVNSIVSDAMLKEIADLLPSLREIRLENCADISGEQLQAIHKEHPALKITIENCAGVSSEVVQSLSNFTADEIAKRKARLEAFRNGGAAEIG